MSATKEDLDDLKSITQIIGGVIAALVILSTVLIIVTIVFVHRVYKKFGQIALTISTTRLDVRKTLEAVENSIIKYPVTSASVVVEDKNDGLVILSSSTEQASPIFTRRTFSPPLTALSLSDNALNRNKNDFRSKIIASSQPRRHRPRPAAPVRRTQSFYDEDEDDMFY